MGNPTLQKIENDLTLTSWSASNTPPIRIKFHQQNDGTNYYRLKCEANPPYTPSGFSTFYIYLGSTATTAQWVYTLDFTISMLRTASDSSLTFRDLFSTYNTTDVLLPKVYLESTTNPATGAWSTSAESQSLNIRLAKDKFGPSWNCPTWVDSAYSDATKPGVATLTQSDQKGVQSVSCIVFTAEAATATANATVDYYTVAITGGPTFKQTSRTFYLNLSNYPKLVGNVTVVFGVTDIRGQTTSYTRTLTIVPYTGLKLTSNDTHRQGGTGQTVILDFKGKWDGSPLVLSCTGVIAKEEGDTATYASLNPTITVSGTTFSYSSPWNGVTFDPQTAYTITATFTDTINTVTFTLPVPVGTPVMSIRDGRVGINNPSPDCALDVGGVIKMNNNRVFALISAVPEANLNNCTEPGFYIYMGSSATITNFPAGYNVAHPALVQVLGSGSLWVHVLYDLTDNDLYTRSTKGSWTSWKKATLT